MTRALLTLRTKADRDKATRWVAGVPAGTRLEFKAPRRSLDQNSLLWQRLTEVAEQMPEYYGHRMTAEDWKDVFVAALRKAVMLPGIDGGIVPIGLRSSDLSKEEFTNLLDLISHFAATKGIILSDELHNGSA
jgi:hypothetical protein